MTGASFDRWPLTRTLLGACCLEVTHPARGVSPHSITDQFGKEASLWHFIKSFAEVKHNAGLDNKNNFKLVKRTS